MMGSTDSMVGGAGRDSTEGDTCPASTCATISRTRSHCLVQGNTQGTVNTRGAVYHLGCSQRSQPEQTRTTRLRKRRFSKSAPPEYTKCESTSNCFTHDAMSLMVMGTGDLRMNKVAASSGVNAPNSRTLSETSCSFSPTAT